MTPWPHQVTGLEKIHDAMNRGIRRILYTSPTGGGKTYTMFELLRMGFPSVLYTNRNFLREQIEGNMTDAGFRFGMRASGSDPALLRDIQLSSMQTEEERVYKQKKWALHGAKLVLVDEAHVQKAETAQKILGDHMEDGAVIVGFTATPLELGGLYDELIVAGNNSELRECGALLPCITYAPNEVSSPKIKPKVDGSISDKAIEGACKRALVHGRVFEHWKRLNPDARPAIGFACSVATSLGWAEEWKKRGVAAAHIDGDNTWIDGVWYDTPAVRQQLRDAMESGEIKIVWNRYVLREGIDWSFIYHGIFATVFGSLASYLQSGGRILRNHSSLDHVIIQDHGGNWWRHGSLNSDRVWELGDTPRLLYKRRERRLREKKDAEPICCPNCSAVRDWGRECPACGHITRRRSRFLIQDDGTLRETEGDIHAPRRVAPALPVNISKWRSMYYRAIAGNRTFLQAEAFYAKENDWLWPDNSFPYMPTRELDWFELVKDVPRDRLTYTLEERKDDAHTLNI